MTSDEEAEYDEAYEESLLSPEEFILEKYQQLHLTMQSFDQEMLLQRYLSAFSQVYDPIVTISLQAASKILILT